ncbi:MAG: hypothetical protein AB7O26_10525 [Planctomycetaceae bacterium]
MSSPGPKSPPGSRSNADSADLEIGKRPGAPGCETVESDSTSTGSPDRTQRLKEQSRLRWHIALSIAAIWIVSLILLASFTANPITLNRDQVLRSEVVITGKVDDPRQMLVKVERVWRGELSLAEVHIENLPATGARAGGSYLFPLSIERSAGRKYRVTESLLPNAAPLIYPATSESEEQLTGILDPPQNP